MKINQSGRFAMMRKTLVDLPPERPLDVASAGGTLWLTLDGDPRDLVLERGERVLIEAPGRVIAYAFDDAVLEVRAVQEPSTVVARRGFEVVPA
ncbi:DUF2917 domain-containing protein [Ramlibacter humi]|nr:DUF2917 domain-containing protein [Ramlibacter humi]